MPILFPGFLQPGGCIPLFESALIGFREAISNNLSLRSGALTYTILLSMVPMLAMSTAVVKGLGGGNQLKQTVYAYLGHTGT